MHGFFNSFFEKYSPVFIVENCGHILNSRAAEKGGKRSRCKEESGETE